MYLKQTFINIHLELSSSLFVGLLVQIINTHANHKQLYISNPGRFIKSGMVNPRHKLALTCIGNHTSNELDLSTSNQKHKNTSAETILCLPKSYRFYVRDELDSWTIEHFVRRWFSMLKVAENAFAKYMQKPGRPFTKDGKKRKVDINADSYDDEASDHFVV